MGQTVSGQTSVLHLQNVSRHTVGDIFLITPPSARVRPSLHVFYIPHVLVRRNCVPNWDFVAGQFDPRVQEHGCAVLTTGWQGHPSKAVAHR